MFSSRKLRMSKWNVFLFRFGHQNWNKNLKGKLEWYDSFHTPGKSEASVHHYSSWIGHTHGHFIHRKLWIWPVSCASSRIWEKNIYITWVLQEMLHALCIMDIFCTVVFKGWIPYPLPSMRTYGTTNVTHFPFHSI